MVSGRLRDRLAADLGRQIVSNELPSGSAFPSEPELVERYDISKTVVREGIQLLASVGLLKVQHGKRTTVTDDGEWDILSPLVQQAFLSAGSADDLVGELHEVRQLLEPHAAAQAALRSTPEDHERLAAILDEMAGSVVAGDSGPFLDRDRAFHLAIVGCGSHNRVLSGILRDVYSIFHTRVVPLSEASLHAAVEQHKAIAQAIRDRDAVVAEQLMSEHLNWAAQHRGSLAEPPEEKPSALMPEVDEAEPLGASGG